MSEPRYLPPGSMRKERRSGRIEGFLFAALAFVVAMLMLLFLALLILRPAAVSAGCCAQSCCAPAYTPHQPPVTCQPAKDPARPLAHVTPSGMAQPVPEPGTLALIAAGTLALWRLT